MLKVGPFKHISDIDRIKSYCLNHDIQLYFMFTISINAPIAVNELLQLRIKDVLNPIFMTCHSHDILLPESLINHLSDYVERSNCHPDQLLFKSAKTDKPLSRQHFHRHLHEVLDELSIDGHYGLQSLKKTFAYHAYQQGIPIETLQHILGHQSKAHTFDFIDTLPPDYSSISLNI